MSHACSRHVIFHPPRAFTAASLRGNGKCGRLREQSVVLHGLTLHGSCDRVRLLAGSPFLWQCHFVTRPYAGATEDGWTTPPLLYRSEGCSVLSSAASSSANHPECDPHDNARPLHPDGNVSYPVYEHTALLKNNRPIMGGRIAKHIHTVVKDKQKLFIWGNIKIPIFFFLHLYLFLSNICDLSDIAKSMRLLRQ